SARQHFLDRVLWCLNRLCACLINLSSEDAKKPSENENKSFIDCMDAVLDLLAPYSKLLKDDYTITYI
ncbi:hypothetical protein DOY81_015389, partial [Sarcophaga bullata]